MRKRLTTSVNSSGVSLDSRADCRKAFSVLSTRRKRSRWVMVSKALTKPGLIGVSRHRSVMPCNWVSWRLAGMLESSLGEYVARHSVPAAHDGVMTATAEVRRRP